MYVSKEADYAVRIMAVLAAHTREGVAERDFSPKYGIPHNFMVLIFPKLSRKGLIEKIKNQDKTFSYKLAREAAKITVLDVIEAVGGALDLLSLRGPERRQADAFEDVFGLWDGLKAAVEEFLSAQPLSRWALRAPKKD